MQFELSTCLFENKYRILTEKNIEFLKENKIRFIEIVGINYMNTELKKS